MVSGENKGKSLSGTENYIKLHHETKFLLSGGRIYIIVFFSLSNTSTQIMVLSQNSFR